MLFACCTATDRRTRVDTTSCILTLYAFDFSNVLYVLFVLWSTWTTAASREMSELKSQFNFVNIALVLKSMSHKMSLIHSQLYVYKLVYYDTQLFLTAQYLTFVSCVTSTSARVCQNWQCITVIIHQFEDLASLTLTSPHKNSLTHMGSSQTYQSEADWLLLTLCTKHQWDAMATSYRRPLRTYVEQTEAHTDEQN